MVNLKTVLRKNRIIKHKNILLHIHIKSLFQNLVSSLKVSKEVDDFHRLVGLMKTRRVCYAAALSLSIN